MPRVWRVCLLDLWRDLFRRLWGQWSMGTGRGLLCPRQAFHTHPGQQPVWAKAQHYSELLKRSFSSLSPNQCNDRSEGVMFDQHFFLFLETLHILYLQATFWFHFLSKIESNMYIFIDHFDGSYFSSKRTWKCNEPNYKQREVYSNFIMQLILLPAKGAFLLLINIEQESSRGCNDTVCLLDNQNSQCKEMERIDVTSGNPAMMESVWLCMK